jgi:hypothetical protein
MNAMLKPMKANPVSNFAQRLNKVVKDALFTLITAVQPKRN